ncbi:phosphoenolpyruvate synthase [Acidithiobacillus thiooxidans]|uniref:Phosphoenolpyruvate synthase n=1 Tax=Acidithiobacillus thiooxidans TaxID=930 RepID=A0A1C2ICF7_ACITH|nr:phosphoenolpyruvate synthase [Acidithiobacillus thiooxidans]OCX71519.1 phosphoenolpyruvate synthase [Acidithiobacillus thiooxidans]OCX73671.1 phosphoenolpyruvate synthase [Acidithiobacillus thiooxidans]OCX75907.1 phosphoenolpyruvate synthase [Acidithiobacillus thiooxidans]OCX81978.1 phosphoenolpyruvate synthase [Acidithiobacillus thiooxidans]OCX84167.1 phosphoenolpyruvate synthase [Acidithiobacillus thiooxidans]
MVAKYIRFFNEIHIEDVSLVGGKNASLGEMFQELTAQGVRVPNGFAVTAEAYRTMLDKAGAWEHLHEALDGLNPNDVQDLARRGAAAREIIYSAPLPSDLQEEILSAYTQLKREYGPTLTVAVRSSATAEDLPTASFAGQQDTYLNISGDAALLDACKRCFASLFTDRAIHYRIDEGFDHFKVALSIGIMKMVRSDLSTSGVMFSLDTETGFRDVVFITASWGLGENVVQGAVDPDEYYVFKPGFRRGKKVVLRRILGSKKIKMIYAEGHTHNQTRNVPTSQNEREHFCLTDSDVLTLADYAVKVEAHYSQKVGESRPMDMEWAKDGLDGHLYMVQARPETVSSQKKGQVLEEYLLKTRGQVLATGRAVGAKIASAPVRFIADVAHLSTFRPGEVLVADTTTPDWEPVMKQAAAIVTNRGGRTCHAAIIARELGIPAIVGTDNATTVLQDGAVITVSCAEGDKGFVYAGALPFEIRHTDLATLQRPATEIMINLGNPEIAFQTSMLPNDGIGLARMEFIINSAIKAHPMALLHPEKVEDKEEQTALAQLVIGFDNPADFFVQRLSEGIGTIAAAFYPKPVVVRMSDFKSNEYASLLGGRWFEPSEDNPMLGFRGASRYAHPDYSEGFALECAAMRRVREDMGLDNVILMLPFVRRVQEADAVLAKMAEFGLKRGEQGLKIYAMCEIPNNVILIDQFAKRFDGFSIGSNDLTQLTLGVDRDSQIVAFDYDERDDGVKEMIRLAVEGCARNGIHSGLCGQAPSDYPEMAEFLVQLGIDSISLNPDTVLATTLQVLEVEKRMGRTPRS